MATIQENRMNDKEILDLSYSQEALLEKRDKHEQWGLSWQGSCRKRSSIG